MTLPEEQPSNGNRHHKAAYKAVQPFDIDSEEDEYRTTLSLSDVENDSVLEDEGDGMLIYKDVPAVRWAAWMPPSWYDACFPPTTPPECQLLRTENIAVPACYLLVGLLQGLSSVAINVMPLDLGATEAQQTTLSSIRSLPASFKLIFGFWSDNVSIGGYRRKPYMLLGWLVASASMLMLLLLTNLNIPARNSGCFGSSNNGEQQQELPDHTPSIPFLSVCILLFGTGFWLADVMGDSIVAEKAKLELPHQRGSIQSTCYACRFFGMMVAAPASTALYSLVGPSSVIAILALLPLTILPLVWLLGEERYKVVQSTEAQCWEIWNTVCSRSVWQPLAFVFVYNVMQVGNSAWREYLVTVLHFTSCQLNMLLIASFVLLYLGIMAYKKWFIHSSWRHVYISCTILNAVLSLLQICLIKGITFGLSPFLFTLGDDAVAEFIQGIQFLPTTIMMVHLCPAGSEGASYAAFTTVNNAALTLSQTISTFLLPIWDVSKEALENGDLAGMVNLTYLTTVVQTAAIGLVWMLPHYKEDLVELGRTGASRIGGFVFLFVTFSSILWSIFVGVMNIVRYVVPASNCIFSFVLINAVRVGWENREKATFCYLFPDKEDRFLKTAKKERGRMSGQRKLSVSSTGIISYSDRCKNN